MDPDLYDEIIRYLALAEAAVEAGDNATAQSYTAMADVSIRLMGFRGPGRPPHIDGPPLRMRKELAVSEHYAQHGVVPRPVVGNDE